MFLPSDFLVEPETGIPYRVCGGLLMSPVAVSFGVFLARGKEMSSVLCVNPSLVISTVAASATFGMAVSETERLGVATATQTLPTHDSDRTLVGC